jgi:hypothetical protein
METFAQSVRAAHSSCLLPDTNVDAAEGLSKQTIQFCKAEWDCRLQLGEGIIQ